ncbi:MAG: hypothetical protein EAZ19_05790 [Oscillatoriales cyanobacterium]|nr:MAG: hypothetical protein EAZ45_03330 [Oscillatoriales cyanobacterium]TAG16788.1 MAG: hypothetical protein EAZ39_15655 [Oscillatoriales cyanobacterium]TAG45244.1 MAG: hypothetical protein EAZ33_08010 [Oscillatoriales cyanobacterium]TAG58039.1 MAG: hypothetical protein EAZ28_16175 [Oscillatoriales cyanobacterium]TAG74761.1 MAG: hypothetical protein EAZ23_05210 [Oscillatoriales cyanobacterium]
MGIGNWELGIGNWAFKLDISNNSCGTSILPVQNWLFWRCLLHIQGRRDTPQDFESFLIYNLNAEQLITNN